MENSCWSGCVDSRYHASWQQPRIWICSIYWPQSPMSARMTANRLAGDLQAVTILLDALAGIGVLVKTEDRYSLAPALAPFLVDDSPESVAAMLRHQANCLRHWARLPWIIHSGESIDISSIRGRRRTSSRSSKRCMSSPERWPSR
jgi:hypothetical protein